jgi:hypothetical protein
MLLRHLIVYSAILLGVADCRAAQCTAAFCLEPDAMVVAPATQDSDLVPSVEGRCLFVRQAMVAPEVGVVWTRTVDSARPRVRLFGRIRARAIAQRTCR